MPVEQPVLDTITNNREREREFLCAEKRWVSVFLYETVVCTCCVMYARIYIYFWARLHTAPCCVRPALLVHTTPTPVTISLCPNAVSYLDIGGVTVLDHVETPVGEVHLQNGAVHQELVDPRVKLRGGVKVLVEDNIRAGASLTFMYEPPQPTPSGDLNTDWKVDLHH